MIRALGSKLQALHIPDDDRHHDDHQIPFSRNVDFEAIVKVLKEINYSGWFTLGRSNYLAAYDSNTVFCGDQDIANAVKKHARIFDSLA